MMMDLTTSTIILGVVISTLYGAIFHLWRGGRAGRLILYLILSWIGFWAGNFLGEFLDIGIGKVGALHFVIASAGSALFLFVGDWLSLSNSKVDNQN
jgi:uncharacterized membrane protein YeaQ/YmgE (transglycosylase-associated protein family)